MTTRFSTLAWRIPWAEELGLQQTVHRVAQNSMTEATEHACMHIIETTLALQRGNTRPVAK